MKSLEEKIQNTPNLHHEYIRELVQETIQLQSHGLIITQNNVKPSFYKIKPHIFERKYVTDVLGIDLPLNESYPYSGPIYHQIIEEQRILEDFFRYTDADIWLIVEEDMLREQEEEGSIFDTLRMEVECRGQEKGGEEAPRYRTPRARRRGGEAQGHRALRADRWRAPTQGDRDR